MIAIPMVMVYDEDFTLEDYQAVVDFFNTPAVAQELNRRLDQLIAHFGLGVEEALMRAMDEMYAVPTWYGCDHRIESLRKAGTLVKIHRVQFVPLNTPRTVGEC